MKFVTAFCLIYMISVVVGNTAALIHSTREERLKKISNYKKGNFVLVYLAGFPLFWMGIVYSGTPILRAVIPAIECTLKLPVFSFRYDAVQQLMDADPFFGMVMTICFFCATANGLLFFGSVFAQRIANFYYLRVIRWGNSDVLAIIGDIQENRMIVRSVNRRNMKCMLFAAATPELRQKAYADRCAICDVTDPKRIAALIEKFFRPFRHRRIKVIVNSGDDKTNLIVTQLICSITETFSLDDFNLEKLHGLDAYVFGNPANQSAFIRMTESSRGCIHYVNKYKMIATRFTDDHSFPARMDATELDTAHACLRDGVEPCMLMIGFGDINRQIFLTFAENNQYMTWHNGTPAECTVRYCVYDYKNASNHKLLNHNYYRYREYLNDIDSTSSDHFPIVGEPVQLCFRQFDVNDSGFYNSIRRDLSGNGGKPFNYIVIAFGDDLENIDLAEKINEKLREWELPGKTFIFVRIRDARLFPATQTANIIPFGDEHSLIYNFSAITGGMQESLAKRRHVSYTVEETKIIDETSARRAAMEKWYVRWKQIQRESNTYAILALRMRLQLLGYDYVSETSDAADASEEYLRDYTAGDPIVYSGETVSGKQLVDYRHCMPEVFSVRNILARLEHQRWNAYMIVNGYIPATPEELLSRDKNILLAQRKHANITTFEGLVYYRNLMAEKNGTDPFDEDVIRYDYQLMDDAPWLLAQAGMKIIRRADVVGKEET